MALESVVDGSGTSAYIPGIAAAAESTATELFADRRGSPRTVRAEQPHTTVLT